MFCVSAIRTLGLAALVASGIASVGVAKAADIEDRYDPPRDYSDYGRYGPAPSGRYEPAPYPARPYEGAYARPPADVGGGGECRLRHERHVDDYGREVVRRFRVCDEGVVAVGPGYEPQQYRDRPYAERPRPWARPPVDDGRGYDDDEN